MAHNLPLAAAVLWFGPVGTHGIAYDIFTNATEHDLPLGYHAPRSKILNIFFAFYFNLSRIR
jgi:hypothetical protein